jgi:hypothetical protein
MRRSASQIMLKMVVGWGRNRGGGIEGWARNIAATFNIKSLAAGVAVVGCVVGTEKDKTSLGATTCIRA